MIVPALPEHRALIVSSWTSSFSASPYAGWLSRKSYWDVVPHQVASLLDRPSTHVLCYVNPDDHAHVFGWVAFSKKHRPCIHYAYVKAAFRDTVRETQDSTMGQVSVSVPNPANPKIALKLLERIGITPYTSFDYSYRSDRWDEYMAKHRLCGTWSPDMARKD